MLDVGSSKIELSATEDRSDEVILKKHHDGEYPSCQKQFSCAEDPISIERIVSSYHQHLHAYDSRATKF